MRTGVSTFPMTPNYSGILGKLWLERGGVYVLGKYSRRR